MGSISDNTGLRVAGLLQSWADEGEPKVMWLAGLHAPETYLAALVQMACRDRGWPLDRSTLYTQVTPYTEPGQVREKPRCAPATAPAALTRSLLRLSS